MSFSWRRSLGQVPWHPFLLAVSPVLALLAANPEQAEAGEAIRPALVMLLGEAVLLGLAVSATRNIHRAAIIASGLTLLFVTYGHVYGGLENLTLLGEVLGRHRYMVPAWAVLAVGVVLVGARMSRPERWTGGLNLASGLLVVAPVVTWVGFAAAAGFAEDPGASADHTPAGEMIVPASPPDVYYILLDGYARGDVLESMFSYDNSEFVEELRSRGFYVAERSTSNYAQTDLSIASSLNMEYLQDLEASLGPDSTARSPLRPHLQRSRLRAALESLGYRTIAFDTGYKATELRDADAYLNPRREGLLKYMEQGELSPFESMLIYATGLRLLADSSKVLPEFLRPDIDSPFERHRQRVQFVLDSLAELPEESGPKFVFVHLISPHQPFVFGPNGEAIDPAGPFTLAAEDAGDRRERSKRAYVGQIEFLNDQVLSVVDHLLQDSETPPVIVLQGDHGPPTGGPSAEDRMSILNALYLPDGAAAELYPSITPVNTFRLILSEYFGADLPLLEDLAYYSTYDAPYDFRLIEASD